MEKTVIWATRERTTWIRYGSAMALSALALFLNLLLHPSTERNLFFISIAAVVLSSAVGGYLPGLLSTGVTTVGLNLFFRGSPHLPRLGLPEDATRIATYGLTGLLMAAMGGALRSALRSARLAQLQAEAATHARDEFISIASHELKTPLTALALQIQFGIRNQIKPDADPTLQQKLLLSTSKTLERLKDMVDDLLDFSQISHGRLRISREEVDLRELIERVLERFSAALSERGYRLSLEAPARVPGFWDPLRIEQVLSNLLSNAIKYGEGKPLSINVTSLRDAVLVAVSDHGPGIAPADQDRLFHKFERFTASKSIAGVGLGLYITKSIVDLHHGRIWIKSDLGKGTTFFVAIPINGEEGRPDLFASPLAYGPRMHAKT